MWSPVLILILGGCSDEGSAAGLDGSSASSYVYYTHTGTDVWLPKAEFPAAYLDAYCSMDCTGDVTRVCESTEEPDLRWEEGCVYDMDAAQDCVERDNWVCDILLEGMTETYPMPPNVCLHVCR